VVTKATGVRECAACQTPAHLIAGGRMRNGWCDACYALSRLWANTRPELVDDTLALDWQRFNDAVAQAITTGDRNVHREHSTLRSKT
jgi:hypothetical protein